MMAQETAEQAHARFLREAGVFPSPEQVDLIRNTTPPATHEELAKLEQDYRQRGKSTLAESATSPRVKE